MKCSPKCKFYCSDEKKAKVFCSRTGWDISELSKEILENCPKFIDRAYIRHDILKSDY